MKKLPVEYIENRKKYILFKNDCGVTDMTRRGDIYEKYIFDYIRNNLNVHGTSIIDIGANFGFHSLEFADLVGEEGKVYAFEPQRLVFQQLCGNVILNGYSNIFTFNVALGNEIDGAKIENPNYYSDEVINVGNSHVNAYTDNGYNWVRMEKLDSYVFEKVSVIKLDVQGYEPFVLDGAIETIKEHRPVIFVEIEPPQLQIYNFTPEDVKSKIEAMGYSLKKVIDAEHLVDYVAIPL